MDIRDLLIDESCTILQAMELLDTVGKRALFIHDHGKLRASLTDGDIRRWILKGGSLEAAVKNAANYAPKFLRTADRREARAFMKRYSVEALPIVDEAQNIVNVLFWDDRDLSVDREKIDIPVVMMAGGLGTRLYPYTKILPKPLIPVGDMPIAELIVRQFKRWGCHTFYLIVNHKKNMIKAYFNEIEKDYTVHYIDETEFLGTGGGLSLLKGKIDSPFILTNCDILITEDFTKIYKHHKDSGNLITMVCSLKNFTIPYGVVDIGEHGEIECMHEKPKMSFFTNTGCYIAEPQVVDELEDGKAVGFPDVIAQQQKKGGKIGVFPIRESDWMDMGQLDELEKMKQRLEANGQ